MINTMKNGGKQQNHVARRVLFWVLATIAVLTVLHLTMQYLNYSVYNEKQGQIYEISNRFDFDDEVSVPTWFSQMLLFAIASCGFLLAYMQRARAPKLFWSLVGGIGVFMSLDEGASLHELVLQIVHLKFLGEVSPVLTDNAWLILLPFIAATALSLLYYMTKLLPRQTIMLCIVGGSIYLGGAVVIDIIYSASAANTFMHKGVLVAIEEVSELIGSAIILFAFMQYIETTYGSRIGKGLKVMRG